MPLIITAEHTFVEIHSAVHPHTTEIKLIRNNIIKTTSHPHICNPQQ